MIFDFGLHLIAPGLLLMLKKGLNIKSVALITKSIKVVFT